jgi:spermidine/putrescine transport system substrate-binding protein
VGTGRLTGQARKRQALSRRGFLAGGASLAGLAATGPLLAGCDLKAAQAGTFNQPHPISPKYPVAWPIFPGNLRIAASLPPERDATLQVLAPAGRVSPRVLAGFAQACKKYNCRVQLTALPTIGQAVAALQLGHYDVLLGLPTDRIGSLVWRKLIQPLNHAYLPNVAGAWLRFRYPYYDNYSRYTVPYTVFTTGFAYRRDLLHVDPYTSRAGWAFPWQAAFRGQVAILDDYRESLSLGLLASGTTDLNSPDPRLIGAAQQQLLNLIRLTGARVSSNVSAELALGQTALRHAWSGHAAAAAALLPGGVPRDVIGYWFPPDGHGPVGSDTGVIARRAASPVLAHLFLNYLLEPANAVTNFRRTGFQPPLLAVTPSLLVREGGLPVSLGSAAVLATFFDAGLKESPLAKPVDLLWHQAWAAVRGQARK